MRRVTALLALLALLLTVLPAATLAAPRDGASREAVIVVFHDSVASPAAAAGELGRRHGFGPQFVYQHALKGFAASIPTGALNALARDPRVAWIEPDQAVHLYEQTTPTGVARIFADENAEITIDGNDDLRIDVDVAIIDSGIDLDHPDLNVHVPGSVNCLNSSSGGPPWARTYTCGSGGDDDNGHGTHVAGTVGALDDGAGVVGVAPGARVWAVKVLDSTGSGSLGAVTAGIDYVTANAGAIEVANMSLGCECASAAMDTAIANSVAAGVTYAVAAGNSDADASTHSPANHPDVITVSALADFDGEPGGLADPTCGTDQDDTLADFSNWGSLIEIAAPGTCILSTVPGGGYDTFSGTSMASPHVAGAAALLAASANYTPDGIRTTLRTEGNPNWTDDSGDGIKEPLLDVSDATVFDPATVAGPGGGGTEPPPDDNTAPTANDVSASGDENTTISWTPSVSDPDTGDALTCSIASQSSSGGTATVQSDCSTGSYTPATDFTGTATFAYAVSDGQASDTGTVTITVNAVSDPPADETFSLALTGSSTSQGSTWTAIVTITATDSNGTALSDVAVSGGWSNDTTASCTTTSSGTCMVSRSQHKRVSSVTFTVTSATHSLLTYDGGPDSVTVLKP